MTGQIERTLSAWSPPEGWGRIRTVDLHTEGEPLRVIVGGYPRIEGVTMLERRRDLEGRFDHLRRTLMWEPRGHADMYGCILTPPVDPEADAGVLFMHNEGYSTMCGHGIIAVARLLVESGHLPATPPVTTVVLDTPAGQVTAAVEATPVSEVGPVSFLNVASWAELDLEVDVPDLGAVHYDLAFGGAFYAYVDAESLGLALDPADTDRIIDAGMRIKRAVQRARPPHHPTSPELSFLYGTILIGKPDDPVNHSRNVCVFADGEVDRSPTGTGVSGRLAIHHARGEIGLDESIRIESILGTTFAARVRSVTTMGPHDAVIPEIHGRAWLTGRHEFLLDPDDPLLDGFLLR